MLILYGSQTGNAQDVAERIAREGKRRHFKPRVLAMDAFPAMLLPEQHLVIFVCSTTGQGEVPSNMKAFWKFLLRKSLAADSLSGAAVAVFGLGDSGYQNYNTVAKKLDRRLAALGGKSVCERGLGDDQHPNGYEAVLDPWLRTLWTQLRLQQPLPTGMTEPPPEDTATELDPKYKLSDLPASEVPAQPGERDEQQEAVAAAYAFSQLEASLSGMSVPSSSPAAVSMQGMTAATSGTTGAPKPDAAYGLWRPFMAEMTCNRRITSQHHFQDTRHIELSLRGSGLTYQPGELLCIFPRQDQAATAAFLQRTGLDPNAWMCIEPAEAVPGSKPLAIKVRVGALVQGLLDVNGASPRRYFFEVLHHFASSDLELDRLEYFSTPAGRDDLYTYNQKEGRTVLEVLQDFKSAQPPLEWLLQTVPHIKPRQFSIASALSKHPATAHITMAVVDYRTPYKRRKQGVCSSWLASLRPAQPAASDRTHVQSSHGNKGSVHGQSAASDGTHVQSSTSQDGLRPVQSDGAHADPSTRQEVQHQQHIQTVTMPDGQVQSSPNQHHAEDATQQQSNGLDLLAGSQHQQGHAGPSEIGAVRQRQPQDGPLVPVWIERGVLQLPAAHSTPLIMVGPGTGVAPFKSFLEERQMAAAGGAEVAPSHLFFGCRSERADFYYQGLWQQLAREGILAQAHGLITAFSRDQRQKVYVQDQLKQHGQLVWDQLKQGAVVYVSGSAEKMPQAVAKAFEEIALQRGDTTPSTVVRRLEQSGRYFVEAWS